MAIELETLDADRYRWTLSGEIGFHEVSTLIEQANQILENPRHTEMDWSEVSWLHTSGLQVLIALRKSLVQGNQHLSFTEPNAPLRTALQEFGIWESLDPQPTANRSRQ